MREGERRALALVVVLAGLLLLPGLGRLDLWAPDEPRIAQVAEELRRVDRGAADLVLLRLNGEPYTQKPPLYYWLAALVGAPGGRVDEAAARLPSALAGVALVGLTAALSLRLFPGSRRAALWAGVVLLSALRFTNSARRAQLDTLLALCETAAIYAFACQRSAVCAQHPASPTSATPRAQTRTTALLCTAVALGLLTKGPVALLVLAAMALVVWWEGGPLRLRDALAPRWIALCIGPVLVWLCAAVALSPPGFAEEALVDNLVGRFFAGTSHARPPWYYARQWPLDFLPWTLVALAGAALAWRRARGAVDSERGAWRLLVAWAGTQFVFFTLSGGKRGLYLLPIYPALAIASGAWLDRVAFARPSLSPRVQRVLALLAAAVVLAGGAIASGVGRTAFAAADLDAGALRLAGGLAAVAVVACAFAYRRVGRRHGAHGQTIAATAAWLAIAAIALHIALPAWDAQKSPRPIAAAAVAVAGERAIGLYEQRATLPGILSYAHRPIESLPNADAVEGFWERGGGALIVRSRQLAEVDPRGRHTVRARVRSGRRELLVLGRASPSDAGSGPPP